MAVQLLITQAGLDALVNAQDGETESIQVIEIGLTASAFTMAPTVEALPGEFKRIDAISGQAVSETIVHMTAQDSSEDIYDLRGLGLYLADGTLFAIYSQADLLFRKVSVASFLLALDIAFANGGATDIVFGDSTFMLPPATETRKGVAEVATSAETEAGTDDERIVTPRKLKERLDALAMAVGVDLEGLEFALAALLARTITGAGLATGGGNLTDNRVLTVPAATASDVAQGIANNRAITPQALSGLTRTLAVSGQAQLPGCGGLILKWGRFTSAANAATSVLFPSAFGTSCFAVLAGGGHHGGADSQDNSAEVVCSTISVTGFTVWSADDTANLCCYMALGI